MNEIRQERYNILWKNFQKNKYEFYRLMELSALIDAQANITLKVLREMEEEGIIEKYKSGNDVVYRLKKKRV